MTIMTFVGTQIQDLEQPVRVYSDWTRQPQFDGVKHNALDLEHMLVYVSMNACFCRPAACAARPGRLGVFQYARFSTSVSHKCSCEKWHHVIVYGFP